MRIWSLHPQYLDARGLVALWREALLAKKVLQGDTKGYRHHPQLKRFKETDRPVDGINRYLAEVYKEAERRGYNFNGNKFSRVDGPLNIPVNEGQLRYEMDHLLKKLKVRDHDRYKRYRTTKDIETHPLFTTREGPVEDWERV